MSKEKISRKEVAVLFQEMTGIEVTVGQVRKNEVRWGIKDARRDLNVRVVRYQRELVVNALKRHPSYRTRPGGTE